MIGAVKLVGYLKTDPEIDINKWYHRSSNRILTKGTLTHYNCILRFFKV